MKATTYPVLKLNPVYLLALYGIIPVALLFLGADWLLNDLQFSHSLPTSPHSMQWFNMFFMLPHIFASMFTFFDRDYVQAYGTRLAWSLPLMVVAAILLPIFFGVGLFMFFIAIYTVYHLVNQQTGIASMIARNKSATYLAWKWMSFFFLLILYLAILYGNSPINAALYPLLPWFLAAYVAVSIPTAMQSRTRAGMAYVGANTAMNAVCYGLYLANQPFFLILIPRFVHDVTAFYFYIAHNTNRNRVAPVNLLSRLRNVVPLPEYILTPLAGIACTAFVTFALADYMTFLMSFLALFHYYWEGVMWKHGTPHRSHIYV